MFKTFLLLLLWIFSPLLADTIGYVQFQVPHTTHGWKLSKETSNGSPKVLLYIPDNVPQGKPPTEYFGATFSEQPKSAHDLESLTALLKMHFPNKKVQVMILNKAPESIIYEWSVGDHPREMIHGWSRIFSTDKGTVALGYLTTEPNADIEKLRNIWVKALEDAKVIQ